MRRRAGGSRAALVALLVLAAAAAGPGWAGTPLLPLLLDREDGVLGGLVPGLTGGPSSSGPPGNGFTPPPANGYAGYATGTVLSAAVGGLVDLVRLNVASADATFRSGDAAGPLTDETGRLVTPALPDRGGFARGAGLQLTALGGAGVGPLVGSAVEAMAPPSRGPVSRETGPLALDPIVRASLVRNQAEARSPLQGCVLGSNLAHGEGQAAGVVVGGSGLGLGVLSTEVSGAGKGPFRSSARTLLVPGTDGGVQGASPALALLSEVRQTVAPVTFLAGTPAEFTLEVGGEWVLSARADGRTGSISFGPEGDGAVPVLRVVSRTAGVIAALTTQQLLGQGGQVLSVPGVAEIAVGEQPRPLLGATGPLPAGASTTAAAAVDVARVRLLAGGADVRIGHMEAAVAVPADGLPCPAPKVTVDAQPASVPAGGEAQLAVGVTNPNDGRLEDLEVDLTLSGPPGVAGQFALLSPGPAPSAGDGAVRWTGLGSLDPGQSKELRFRFLPPATSAAGRITVDARVVGRYRGLAPAAPTAVEVPVTGAGTGGVDITRPAPPVDQSIAAAPPAPAPAPVPPPAAPPPTSGRQAGAIRPRSPAEPPPAPPVTAPPATVPPAPPPAGEAPVATGDVAVPDVTGLPLEEASARLRQAGLSVAVDEAVTSGPGPVGQVVAQLPPPGTPVPAESTVTVLVRPEAALPAPAGPRAEGVDRDWFAFAAVLLAAMVGVLIVRHGRKRQRKRPGA